MYDDWCRASSSCSERVDSQSLDVSDKLKQLISGVRCTVVRPRAVPIVYHVTYRILIIIISSSSSSSSSTATAPTHTLHNTTTSCQRLRMNIITQNKSKRAFHHVASRRSRCEKTIDDRIVKHKTAGNYCSAHCQRKKHLTRAGSAASPV